MEGIASVLKAAKSESSGIADQTMAEMSTNVPTVDEYIQTAAHEMANPPSSPGPKRGRGRPKGSKNSRPSSPFDDGMSGEDRTRAYVQKMAESQGEDSRAVYLRKKITKIFDYFPHKIARYYPNRPNVAYLSVQQLIDTERLLVNILDEGDESVYVKEGFKWVAGVVENSGPSIHRRFLKWVPGADILQHQHGLAQTVDELVDLPGDEGLADEVNRISLEFIGWAPSNPWVNAGLKLFKIMQGVKQARIEAPIPPVTGGDPMNNI